ncbi:hypothetical protein HHL23_18105 [Chryseobacterium sp. RP-3-3]|uniref:Lipoprotein n=1 Tax=Chryseobacterium antibioticum TaxID=2728847 RepID=A0A7Y0AQM6_9FLAO|nr:hypothetical protein [Chryseobacterium antibioticum]NML71695.1 hypothetical protein [Chryseobacterium antibioticum]
MVKKIISSVILLNLFYSCQSQDSKVVLIDKLDKTFDVSSFFKPRLQKTDELLSTDVKKLDKNAAKKALQTAMFAKDTLAFYQSNGRLPTEFYLESTNDWMSRKEKPVKYFGYKYHTVAYDETKDTLAILNKVAFPALDMTENNKGEFVYLNAHKTSKNKNDTSNLLSFLQKNFTRVTIEDNSSDEISCWENKDFYYILSKEDGQEEEILSYDLSGNKNSKITDITDIRLQVYSKDFIQTLRNEHAYIPDYIPAANK